MINSLWISNDKYINPSDLKYYLTGIVTKFLNSNQHDSHELLISFLDLLHDELNLNANTPYSLDFPVPKMESETDIDASKRFWNFHRKYNNSIIVDLFHGQLRNKITCLSCNHKSVTFDPFVTLPLSIPNMKKIEVHLVPSINIKSTIKLAIYISEAALFFDLDFYIKKYLDDKFKYDNLRFRYLFVNGATSKFIKNGENIYQVSKKGFIFCHEIDERINEGNDYYPFIVLIRESFNLTKSFSYPRLFPINPYVTVKEMRYMLFGFMKKYLVDLNNKSNFVKLIESYNEYKMIDENDYDNAIKEEYNTYFNLSNRPELPYVVNLVSSKDENLTKLFLSNDPLEFNKTISDSAKIEKLIDIIKLGYKLVIEINTNEELKNQMNHIVSISNKDKEMDFTKNPSLNDLIEHFSLVEKLDKGNEWYCPNCKKLQNSIKSMSIFYAPKYFIILLKRFESKILSKTKIQLLKNNIPIKYPVNNLNLNNYVLGPKDPKPIYDLYAASQHSGSTEGGHNATACRNFGKWYEFDDISVFPSDEDLVVSPEGYILFYRRKN